MSLRHAVLGLLAQRPSSGYDLMKLFETSLANVWTATQSQVYGELGKMDEAALIRVSAQGPRGRKEYTITDEGLAELRHWLTEVEPSRARRSEILLRVFLLGALSREQARHYIDHMAELSAERHRYLVELDKSLPWDDDPLSVYGKLVIEYGLRLDTMVIEWAQWAGEQIDRSHAGGDERA